MKYINTKPITVHLLAEQRELVEEIQKEINKEFGIKVPLTELIRRALTEGLPCIQRDKKSVIGEEI